MLLETAEGHKAPNCIALKDQDVVQIILDTIYLKLKVTDDLSKIKLITETRKNLLSTIGNLSSLEKSKN